MKLSRRMREFSARQLLDHAFVALALALGVCTPALAQEAPSCTDQCHTVLKACLQNSDSSDAAVHCTSSANACIQSCSAAGVSSAAQPPQAMSSALQQQYLAQLQQEMRKFSKQLAAVKTNNTKLQKKNVAIPSTVTDALDQMSRTADAVMAAQHIADIAGIDMDSQLKLPYDTVESSLPNIMRLSERDHIYGRIDAQIAKLSSSLAADKKLEGSFPPGYTQSVSDAADTLSQLKDAYAAAKQKIAAGDINGGFDQLNGEVTTKIDALTRTQENLRTFALGTTSIAQFSKEYAVDRSKLARIKRKTNISAAQTLIDEAQLKTTALRKSLNGSKNDVAGRLAAFDAVNEVRSRLAIAMNQIKGVPPTKLVDQGVPLPFLQLPDTSGLAAFAGK